MELTMTGVEDGDGPVQTDKFDNATRQSYIKLALVAQLMGNRQLIGHILNSRV